MNRNTRHIVAVLAITGFSALIYISNKNQDQRASSVATPQPTQGRAMAEVIVPALEGNAQLGQLAFVAKCASCHGENAVGQLGVAPPLVHKIYEPSHHGDMAFVRAARNGVRAHHWKFGNMPPVDGISDAEVGTIVAYVRALQRANGIH